MRGDVEGKGVAARERLEEPRAEFAAPEEEYAVAKAKLSRLGITEEIPPPLECESAS